MWTRFSQMSSSLELVKSESTTLKSYVTFADRLQWSRPWRSIESSRGFDFDCRKIQASRSYLAEPIRVLVLALPPLGRSFPLLSVPRTLADLYSRSEAWAIYGMVRFCLGALCMDRVVSNQGRAGRSGSVDREDQQRRQR